MSGGTKHDGGKARHDLMPEDALEEIAKVLAFGAEKYAPHNWELGMDWGRVYAAMRRHMAAFWCGEDMDPETGLPHTAHAATCALFLLTYQIRNAGTDDRFIAHRASAE